MGRPFIEHLEGRVYCCKLCRCNLAKLDEIVSKHFHSKNGKAYLFNTVVNVCEGPKEERLMTTGAHIVRDIYCTGCMVCVGWKYEEAYERPQKYKEGKYILERVKVDNVTRPYSSLFSSRACDSDSE